MNKKKKKVLMALSGGIDSAVSAYLLLKQGYEVEAAFMKNWTSQEGLLKNECPWLEDRRDALRVAAFLRIPFHTLDFEKEYQKTVMKYFFDAYKKGLTPNPDVMCNKEIKFKMLYNWAMKNGFDYMATGHYARVGYRAKGVGGRKKHLTLAPKPYTLMRSADEFKDQTYFIYNIKTEQLPHVLFPIGGMKKPQVRSLARKLKLPNSEKKESMGLCFVGKIRLKDFLEQKLKAKPGKIVLQAVGYRAKGEGGREKHSTLSPKPYTLILGTHRGLHNYTIGQRQGIKVGGNGPYYVLRKDLKNNTLFVTNDANDKGLEIKEVELHSVNWINLSYQLQATSYQLAGRYRHQGDLVPLAILQTGKDPSRLVNKHNRAEADHYKVVFKHPQKAVASGQSLVLYKGKECVGGGIIA